MEGVRYTLAKTILNPEAQQLLTQLNMPINGLSNDHIDKWNLGFYSVKRKPR
jgi:hypothetical protein